MGCDSVDHADLPALGAEAVVGIVAVVSPQDQGIVCKLLTAHQIAQTVVAVQIHGAVAAIGLRDAVNLPVAVSYPPQTPRFCRAIRNIRLERKDNNGLLYMELRSFS